MTHKKPMQVYEDTHRKIEIIKTLERDSFQNTIDKIVDYYIEKRRLKDWIRGFKA